VSEEKGADMIDRRTALKALAGSLMTCQVADAGAEPPTTKALEAAAAKGRRFLGGLLDPALDLLPEYRGANVYWLYHDNYLAAKALARTDPALAKRITAAIRRHGVEESGKIEILFAEATRPLPFRHPRPVEVKRIGDKVIKAEVAGEEVFKGWEEYADLLFLAAIASADTSAEEARRHFEEGMRLWDGVGFKDRVAKKAGKYAAYKVALALFAAGKLKVQSAQQEALVERLLRQQGEDGGWVTDYDEKGRPLGRANVETTALAVLALDAPAGEANPGKFKITTRRKDDSVEVKTEKGKTLFIIKSPFGISQAVIEREGEKWPDAVVLRLHLKGLESFRASNGKVKLDAAVGMQEAKVKVRLWKDGKQDAPLDEKGPLWADIRILGGDGKPAKELPLKDGYFEMALPRAFFEGNPKSLTLDWIDFYR
jgi:hypothetical protein